MLKPLKLKEIKLGLICHENSSNNPRVKIIDIQDNKITYQYLDHINSKGWIRFNQVTDMLRIEDGNPRTEQLKLF